MKNFALKLVLFALAFLAFDKIFILVANKSAEAEIDKRLESLIKGEIKKDLIIAGSSRGSRDIIASRIEEKTGHSSYNLCYPGSNVEFHEFVLRTLIRFNDPPKIILLVVDDNNEFINVEKAIFRLDRLYPLVKYPYIRKELIDIGEKDRYLSKLFVLHNLNKANFNLKDKKFSALDTLMNCGSMPVSFQRVGKTWDFNPEERIYPIENEDLKKLNAFRKILNICKTHDITLFLIFPPNYQNFSEAFEARLNQLVDDDTAFYIYNFENPIYKDKDYFYDQEHLVKKGAIIFTDELAQFLNESNRNK